MTTRGLSGWIAAAGWVGVVVAIVPVPVGAADGNKACGLLTPSELESVLGNLTLNGGTPMTGGKTEICMGQAASATVMLRLVTGLDPGRDRSGNKEKAGIELFKKMGVKVDVKTFGPITYSTIVPSESLAQHGFNTTCTVSKETAVAGIEVTAENQKDMVPIERLHPLAEKMAGRF